MKIGWITDLHIGLESDPHGLHHFALYLQMAAKRYDYIIITGDLVDVHPRDTYHQRFQSVVDLIHQYGPDKIRVIPGNHDYMAIEQTAEGTLARDFSESAWGQAFGPDYEHEIVTPEVVFAFARLNIFNDEELDVGHKRTHDYTLLSRDCKTLETIVDSMKDRHQRLFLFTHLPLFIFPVVGPSNNYNNSDLAWKILNKLQKQADIMSGHWHIPYQVTLPSTQHQQMILSAFFKQVDSQGAMIGRSNYVIRCEHGRVERENHKGFKPL